ncbi:hypothetical protein NOCARDAX2BIS_380149 [Nocardioides sp. AX2bis]|nr:hypothetical protein NOCARDAX2BIS_380149 [Nocardioides sp. AX2bis]
MGRRTRQRRTPGARRPSLVRARRSCGPDVGAPDDPAEHPGCPPRDGRPVVACCPALRRGPRPVTGTRTRTRPGGGRRPLQSLRGPTLPRPTLAVPPPARRRALARRRRGASPGRARGGAAHLQLGLGADAAPGLGEQDRDPAPGQEGAVRRPARPAAARDRRGAAGPQGPGRDDPPPRRRRPHRGLVPARAGRRGHPQQGRALEVRLLPDLPADRPAGDPGLHRPPHATGGMGPHLRAVRRRARRHGPDPGVLRRQDRHPPRADHAAAAQGGGPRLTRGRTVPETGLEPAHPKAQEPKSCVSASSTTPA